MVDIGGDIALRGEHDQPWWMVEVVHPLDSDGALLRRSRVAVAGGGVATSSTLRQRWRTDRGEVHHIVDPRTGSNPSSVPASATVIAGTAWWAEAQSTALLVDRAALEGVVAQVTEYDGETHFVGGFENYVLDTESEPET